MERFPYTLPCMLRHPLRIGLLFPHQGVGENSPAESKRVLLAGLQLHKLPPCSHSAYKEVVIFAMVDSTVDLAMFILNKLLWTMATNEYVPGVLLQQRQAGLLAACNENEDPYELSLDVWATARALAHDLPLNRETAGRLLQWLEALSTAQLVGADAYTALHSSENTA